MENDMSNLTYRFNFGKKIQLPVYCWYIEGADKHILVDTGADAKMAMEFRGFPAKEIAPFEDALASVGLKPEDIDLVIQTHLHWDHCANTSKCKNAKVIATEDEFLFALSPHPILAPTYKRDLLKDLDFLLVKGQYEIAPGIELIPAPGHTPGTQAVSINTDQGKAIITGFCCIRENFYACGSPGYTFERCRWLRECPPNQRTRGYPDTYTRSIFGGCEEHTVMTHIFKTGIGII
jgi:glyoxylase-like metal-dependent hydrolase (beta-lactamase superfamily II)